MAREGAYSTFIGSKCPVEGCPQVFRTRHYQLAYSIREVQNHMEQHNRADYKDLLSLGVPKGKLEAFQHERSEQVYWPV